MCNAVGSLTYYPKDIMCTVGQSNKRMTHSWLTSIKALLHMLFGLLVPPEKQVVKTSGYAPSPRWLKLKVQRLWSATRQNSDTNKEQDLFIISVEKQSQWQSKLNLLQLPIMCTYNRVYIRRLHGELLKWCCNLLFLFVLDCNLTSGHIVLVSPSDRRHKSW